MNERRAVRFVSRIAGYAWLLQLMFACEGSQEPQPRAALTVEQLQDPTQCKDCHPKHYNEWSASMHAYAGKDPVFLAMNRRGQEETGGALGAFCVNCHMPMAVRSGAIPDFAHPEQAPEHLQGVTCYFCHNAVSVDADHSNGKLNLANDTTMRAAIDHALIPSVHKVQFSKNHSSQELDSSIMCGTCHDIVNPDGFRLEQTFTEYMSSIVAHEDPTVFQSCQNCHMDRSQTPRPAAQSSGYPGVLTSAREVHEHLFPGVDLPLTPFPFASAMRQAVENCKLPNSLAYFSVTLSQPPLPTFTMYVETQAGHAQPSGATQDRRMWVEVAGFDAAGNQVFTDGVVPDGVVEETPGAPHTCMMRDYMQDAAGNEVHMFWQAVKKKDPRAVIPPPTSATAGSHSRICTFTPRTTVPLARIELTFRIRPIGLDVLQDLVASGHLAPEVMAQMQTLTVAKRTVKLDSSGYRYTLDDSHETIDCDSYKAMLDPDQQALTGQAGAAALTAGSGR